MVLDPLSALGLASSVVQFVDFSSKLISKGHAYYKSADGSLAENKEHTDIASNLLSLNDRLDTSLSLLKKHRGKLSNEELALNRTISDCRVIGEEFVAIVDSLRVHGSKTRVWKSFRQACKTIWKREEIEHMLGRLDRMRQQVVIHLLVVNHKVQDDERQSLDAIAVQFTQLKKHNRVVEREVSRIEKNLVQAIVQLKSEFESDIANLSTEVTQAVAAETQYVIGRWQVENRDNISKILRKLDELEDSSKIVTFQRRILDSLYFDRIEERRTKVHSAHNETLGWVFGSSAANNSEWTELRSWFRERAVQRKNEEDDDLPGLYWISGKAGSGKSTLMKYLYNDPRTTKYLRSWAGTQKVILASCFFWHPGSDMQKSLGGLLRSLLYDLLQKRPSLIPLVVPSRWQSYDLGLSHHPPWSDRDLSDALHVFIQKTMGDLHICVFVDGLDEFDGNDEERLEIISLLKGLSHSPHVKLCISSRPWQVFHDAFERCPRLLLEDLTRDDIQSYVRSKLGQNTKFTTLQEEDPDLCSNFVSEIVGKASGVFLWVILVVRSLLQGLRNEDSVPDLMRRLRIIPADLDAYFTQMITRVEPFYRAQAAELFRIVSKAESPRSLLTLSFLLSHEEQDPNFATKVPIEAVSENIVSARLRLARRRLNVRCLGLLEVSKSSDGGLFLQDTVDFLHRTVRDFLELSHTKRMLDTFSDASFDDDLFMCRSFVAQMKMLSVDASQAPDVELQEPLFAYDATVVAPGDIEESTGGLVSHRDADRPSGIADFFKLLDECLFYATRLEEQSNTSLLPLLIDLNLTIKAKICEERFGSLLKDARVRRASIASFPLLALSIQRGLARYAAHEINSNLHILTRYSGPLILELALQRNSHQNEVLPSVQDRPHPEVVRAILAQGVDPNAMVDGSTIWGRFEDVIERLPGSVATSERMPWLEVTELLIHHGAAMYFRTEDYSYSRRVTVMVRSSRKFKDAFGKAEADRLDRLLWWARIPGRRLMTSMMRSITG